MGVCLKSDIWRFMAEPFGNQYRVGSKVDQCRCMGVPEIVDADFLYACPCYPDIESTPDIIKPFRKQPDMLPLW